MRPALPLIVLLALPLQGCGLEEIFNPGASRRAAEYRASITSPVPVAPAAVETPIAAPVEPIVVAEAAPVPQPEPAPVVTAPPEPPAPAVCSAIFRILSCGDNGEFIYL